MGSFLAKQPDTLSKLLHSCSDHLSPCWTKDRLEFSCRHHRGLWPRPHARTHAQNTQLSQQRSQINARRFIPTAVRVTDCRSVSAALSTSGSFCTSLYSGTKGQLKCVCVRWLRHSSAFFLKHSHTNPGLATLTVLQNQTNTQKNGKLLHTGSMGKFLTTSKSWGRSLTARTK